VLQILSLGCEQDAGIAMTERIVLQIQQHFGSSNTTLNDALLVRQIGQTTGLSTFVVIGLLNNHYM
jgi:hypothetical protein